MVLMKGGSSDGCRTTWWVSTGLVCGIEEGESSERLREKGGSVGVEKL